MIEKGKARPDPPPLPPKIWPGFIVHIGLSAVHDLPGTLPPSPLPPPPPPRPSILLKVGEHHLYKEPGAANSLAIVPMKLNEWSRIKHLNSHR